MIKSRMILIAGGSGSGKSYLAQQLLDQLGPRASLLTLDHFYHDLSHLPPAERERANFDHPNAIDWPAVENVVALVKAGMPAAIPRYDFTTHTRLPETDRLAVTPLLILEGLFPLSRPALRRSSELSIFIDCPADLRLSRRIARDIIERGRTEESVRRQFDDFVGPMHDHFVQPQRAEADRVLGPDFGLPEITDLLRHPSFASP